MGKPARAEIKSFAEKSFVVARDKILIEREKKQGQLRRQVRLNGNSGGYLPAQVGCEEKFLRRLILAWVKAYGEAFTYYGLPADKQLDAGLTTFALQAATDSISRIRGHLQLRSQGLRIVEEGSGVPWHLQIERTVDAALKEGRIRLERQRTKMTTRGDFLERLPKDDPNYEIAKRFHLEAWADSHGLVADTLAGKVSFSEWVEGCINTFAQAAATQVAFTDAIPPEKKCAEVDRMAKAFIHQFSNTLRANSKLLGKASTEDAIDHLSRSVNQIAARSKQQIFQRALEQAPTVEINGKCAVNAPLQESPSSIHASNDEEGSAKRGEWPIADEADARGIAKALGARGGQVPTDRRKIPKLVRRNQRYLAIDRTLHEIAESRPRTQEDVFQSLQDRHVVIPPAEPFLTARGWIPGFRRDQAAARAWLSKRWRELDLPPLPRGPKSLKNKE